MRKTASGKQCGQGKQASEGARGAVLRVWKEGRAKEA